jgi:HSP20 family molecular chaperone IbpA
MQTIIHPTRPASRIRPLARAAMAFRKPVYDCQTGGNALTLVVYVPGVDASGISIEARGPDLIVTARKTRFVRVNWQSLNLEPSQNDYRLSLRLGRGLAYASMQAEFHQGVLTLTVPKRAAAATVSVPAEKNAIYGT